MLQFSIRHPDGRLEPRNLKGERFLLGSASHCHLRFPPDQAAYEHVLIEVVGGLIRAQVKASEPPCLLNGAPFTSSPLGPNSVLRLGNTEIAVLVVPDTDEPGAGAGKKKGGSSPLRLVVLLLGAAGAYMMVMDEEPQLPPPPTSVPALFGSAFPPCPQTAPAQALIVANENLVIADGKRERHPFAPGQAVAAVELYRLSASCYKVARAEANAKEAEAAGRALENSVTADFRARSIRLKHMLTVNDYELAARDVAVLQTLTAGARGPYAQWLATVSEDLKRKAAK